jgi:8-oxo-dGTP diphosphatase
MLQVNFHASVSDDLLKIAAIVSRYNNKWVLCREKTRNTFEIPGGHRESHESILETAKRELYEETGATDFDLYEVCAYSILGKDNLIDNKTETFGMLYLAIIREFEPLPPFEIAEIVFSEEIPSNCTYPLVQPKLIKKATEYAATTPLKEYL